MPFVGNTDLDWSVSVGTDGGNREDLTDVITNIQRTMTPFLSSFQRGPNATATLHEWLADIIEQPTAVQATPEVTDATFAATLDPQRLFNNTHIMRKTLEVSDTQEAVRKAGRASEIQYRQLKRFKELARQTEFNLIFSTFNNQTQTGNAVTSPLDDARRMAGIREYLGNDPAGQTLTTDFEGTEQGTTFSPREFLTEGRFNNFLQAIWDNHGMPNTIWVNSVQKRIISTFDGGTTRNIDMITKRITNMVSIYESDFGVLSIHLHDLVSQTDLYALQMEMWALSWLRGTVSEVLARIGNTTKIMIEHELTLEARAPNSSGRMFDLSDQFAAGGGNEGTPPTYDP